MILLVVLIMMLTIGVNSLSSSPNKKVLRVCQSPGCIADGAVDTLDSLSALSPPSIQVCKGPCISLCGSGPVVEVCNIEDTTSIKKKRIKGSKSILALLNELKRDEEDGDEIMKQYMFDRLVMGYELAQEANDIMYKAKDYKKSIELYEDAIQNGRKPAMILQEARQSANIDNEEYNYRGIDWLVSAFKNSCRARLMLKDVDNARRDAFASTIFSQNMDPDAHECLAEVCLASTDKMGELQAIKAAIGQYERLEEELSKPLPGADAPARAEAAKKKSYVSGRKRELGFRIVKLELELKG